MARSPMPPPPTTPAMAEYDRKLTASTVSASTRPERASTMSTRQTICSSEAPMACAASITPRGTSRRHWSTRRARYGMAATDSGTAAASGPMEVPASQRVKGTSATSKMMKGKDRTVLTVQFSTAKAGRLSSDWPGPSRNSSTPSGPPMSTAAVWPMASHSSGRISTMFSDMGMRNRKEEENGTGRKAGTGEGPSVLEATHGAQHHGAGGAALAQGLVGTLHAQGLEFAAQQRGALRRLVGTALRQGGQREAFGHLALLDDGHLAAQRIDHGQLVRDDDDGHAQAAVDVGQRGQDGARGLAVQRRGGLVAQQHLRARRQGARNRHALLLAARQLGRMAGRLVGQAHDVQALAHALLDLGTRMATVDAQRKGHVLEHGGVLQRSEEHT